MRPPGETQFAQMRNLSSMPRLVRATNFGQVRSSMPPASGCPAREEHAGRRLSKCKSKVLKLIGVLDRANHRQPRAKRYRRPIKWKWGVLRHAMGTQPDLSD